VYRWTNCIEREDNCVVKLRGGVRLLVRTYAVRLLLVACLNSNDLRNQFISSKVKLCVHREGIWVSGGMTPLILNFDARWRSEVIFTPRPP
jgi:hypothetical protein